jgi:hypothetical protein
VGGDLLAPTVRDRRDRAHLLEVELRSVDRLVLSGDAARDHDLDQVGAELELAPNRLAQLVGPIGLQSSGRAVAVTAGADDRRTGRPDARAFDAAALDRIPDGEVGLRILAHEAHGRHAGAKRLACVLGHP